VIQEIEARDAHDCGPQAEADSGGGYDRDSDLTSAGQWFGRCQVAGKTSRNLAAGIVLVVGRLNRFGDELDQWAATWTVSNVWAGAHLQFAQFDSFAEEAVDITAVRFRSPSRIPIALRMV